MGLAQRTRVLWCWAEESRLQESGHRQETDQEATIQVKEMMTETTAAVAQWDKKWPVLGVC